jgi:hypothetical protein
MQPAERMLRYPNLASYLEENLPTRNVNSLQCPWRTLKTRGNHAQNLFETEKGLHSPYKIPKVLIKKR